MSTDEQEIFVGWSFFYDTIFVSSQGTQVIVGSMIMGYISDTARTQTHNLFRPKRKPIPLGHSDGVPSVDLLNPMPNYQFKLSRLFISVPVVYLSKIVRL